MATNQRFIYGLIIYFVGISIIISLFSIAGSLEGTGASFNTNDFSSSLSGNLNETHESEADVAKDHRSVTKDLFSFFVWNVSFTDDSILTEFLWLFRTIFVYIPLTALLLCIYFALPFVSGS